MVFARLRTALQMLEVQLSAAEQTWSEVAALMGPPEAQGRAPMDHPGPPPVLDAPTPVPEAIRTCAECDKEIPARRSGAPGRAPRYCNAGCRKAVAKRRAGSNGSASEPAPVENWDRPMHAPLPDGHSDAAALAPPALPWDAP
jgi:hypothetical protein